MDNRGCRFQLRPQQGRPEGTTQDKSRQTGRFPKGQPRLPRSLPLQGAPALWLVPDFLTAFIIFAFVFMLHNRFTTHEMQVWPGA